MKRLFGMGKPTVEAPKPTLGDASKRLEERGNTLDAKIKGFDEKLAKLAQDIKKTRGPAQQRLKQQALQILQQKKAYEGQRNQIGKQQFTVDQIQFTTETMQDTKLQVQAMRDASKGLQQEFKSMKMGDIDKLTDELQGLMEDANDIQEVLAQQFGVPEDLDEDDLAAELDALAAQMETEGDASYLDAALKSNMTPSTSLPARPQGTVVVPQARPQEETTNISELEQQLGL